MDSYYIDYSDYFKEIATNHVAIRHQDEKGEKAFYHISIEDVFIGAGRNEWKQKGRILVLMDPIININRSNTHSIKQSYEGGFMILAHFKKGDETDHVEKKNHTHEIAYDIINRMIMNSKEGHPLFNYSIDGHNAFNVDFADYKGDGYYTGTRCTFSFMTNKEKCVYQSKWVDDLETAKYIDENCIK